MTKPTYNVEYIPSKNHYIFESTGKKGIIIKVVIFTEIQNNIYNLGFGDYNLTTSVIDDVIVSNNGDIIKVLATIVSIADHFLSKNPFSSIYF